MSAARCMPKMKVCWHFKIATRGFYCGICTSSSRVSPREQDMVLGLLEDLAKKAFSNMARRPEKAAPMANEADLLQESVRNKENRDLTHPNIATAPKHISVAQQEDENPAQTPDQVQADVPVSKAQAGVPKPGTTMTKTSLHGKRSSPWAFGILKDSQGHTIEVRL